MANRRKNSASPISQIFEVPHNISAPFDEETFRTLIKKHAVLPDAVQGQFARLFWDEQASDLSRSIARLAHILDEGVIQSLPYRFVLEEIHAQGFQDWNDPKLAHARLLRSAFLRSFIVGTIALLEQSKLGDNRANIGGILTRLRQPEVSTTLAEELQYPNFRIEALALFNRHKKCLKSATYKRAQEIRNQAIGHILVNFADIPKADYPALFELHENTKHLMVALFALLDLGSTRTIAHEEAERMRAQEFWKAFSSTMNS